MSELRPVWTCRGDGCGLRVRQADGRPIPEPKTWEAGRCPHCRIECELQENGGEAAENLRVEIFGGRRRARGPFAHSDPEFDKPKEKRPRVGGSKKKEPTRQQRDEIDTALRTAFDTDKGIARAVGLPVRCIAERRRELGLSNGPERRTKARLAKLEKFLLEDPERMRWSPETIGEAIGEEAAKVRADRIHLGLNPGKGSKAVK